MHTGIFDEFAFFSRSAVQPFSRSAVQPFSQTVRLIFWCVLMATLVFSFSAQAVVTAPTLSASAGNAQLVLTWTAVSSADGYDVQQSSTGNSGSWTQIATPDSSFLNYTQTGLTNGSIYYFRVRAFQKPTFVPLPGPWSNVVSAAPLAPPSAAPANFTAVAGNAQVALSWNAVSGAAYYTIWSKSGANPYVIIQNVSTTSYINSGLSNGTQYDYAISAVNASGASPYSYVSAMPLSPIPPTPTNLLASSYNRNPVSLSWGAVPGATSYDVFRSTSPISNAAPNFPITSVSSNSWTDTTASQGTLYYYAVAAKYNGARSDFSNQANVTPLATPTGFISIPGTIRCFLSWNPVAGAANYVVNGSCTVLNNGVPRTQGFFSTTITATNYLANFYTGSNEAFGYQQIFSVQAINKQRQ